MNFADAILKELRELKQQRIDTMSAGALPDYGAYQRLAGVIEGLSMAEREVLDLQRLQEFDDE